MTPPNFHRAVQNVCISACTLLFFVGSGGALAADSHRVRVEGRGPVTVVFENGLGDTLDVWRDVQARVALCTLTFSYNRAGYAGSTRVDGERDARAVVDELRAELVARGLRPPYLLAGHSLGGLYVQYFARRHPAEVAGVVLVDATHWAHLERIRLEAPGSWRTLKALSLVMTGTMRREFKASEAAGAQVIALPKSSAPTIVLSSTRASTGELPAFRELVSRLQNETAAANATRRHDFVANSAHYIQRDRPDAVSVAIEELAGCATSP